MKSVLNKLALSFALAGVAGVAYAESPIIPLPGLGENAGIRALLKASVAYNDNIYLSENNEKSDTIFTIAPGFEFSSGENGDNHVSLRFVENCVFYMDQTDNNRALENVDFTFQHNGEGQKLQLSVAAGFHHNQSSSNRDSATKGTMTRSYNYYANAMASYKLGEAGKFSVRGGLKWNGTSYENSEAKYWYNDRQQYAVPVYLYYAVDKLNVGLSGEYRYVDLASSKNNIATGKTPGIQQVWFFGLSADGVATESGKLKVNGRIGLTTSDYSRRTIDNNDGDNTLGMTVSANYEVTTKLATSLTLNRDFELDGSGYGITSTGVTLGAKYAIDEFWSANASLGYRLDDYQVGSREDDCYTFTVGANYEINEYAGVFANYSLGIDDSNAVGQDYTNNIVTVGVSVRY